MGGQWQSVRPPPSDIAPEELMNGMGELHLARMILLLYHMGIAGLQAVSRVA